MDCLPNFAFNFNLRRYAGADTNVALKKVLDVEREKSAVLEDAAVTVKEELEKAGRCRLDPG